MKLLLASCLLFFVSLDLWFVDGLVQHHGQGPNRRHFQNPEDDNDHGVVGLDRRKTMECIMAGITAASFGTGVLLSLQPAIAATDKLAEDVMAATQMTTSINDFSTYNIIPDASPALDPKLVEMNNNELLTKLASASSSTSSGGSAIWLGEHHNSLKDHRFQADFIRQLHNLRSKILNGGPMAIGLEQVQIQFQSVLDEYIVNKSIDLDTLRSSVEWDKRWMWSFDGYAPIFQTCRELNIRLLALNVDSEDLALVEKNGYAGLPIQRLRKYIQDPIGFGKFAQQSDFKTYANYVVSPSYDIHEKLGLLQYTIGGEKLDTPMSFGNFLSGRILWDEGMANSAYQWVSKNPGGLMIGLVGADHVKFQNGIPARFVRLASNGGNSSSQEQAGTAAATTTLISSTSIIINPTLIDTRPSGSVSNIVGADSSKTPDKLTLQLRYNKPDGMEQGGVLPFADYIVVTG